MEDSTRIVRSPDVMESSPGEDSVVLLGMETNQYYSLDGVGAVIWRQLDAPVGQLLEALLEAFDVDEPTARRDLESLIQDLANAGLARIE